MLWKGKGERRSGGPETHSPLYTYLSFTSPPSPPSPKHHTFLKGIAKKEEFLNCRLISNHTSTPFNGEWVPTLLN